MGSDEERTGGRSKEKEETLASSCSVCGSPAAAHLHYGAVSCYSCRAFFRRGQPKQVRCIFGHGQCKISRHNRTNCKLCRYRRCLEVGMKPEKVDFYLNKRKEREREKNAGDESSRQSQNSPHNPEAEQFPNRSPASEENLRSRNMSQMSQHSPEMGRSASVSPSPAPDDVHLNVTTLKREASAQYSPEYPQGSDGWAPQYPPDWAQAWRPRPVILSQLPTVAPLYPCRANQTSVIRSHTLTREEVKSENMIEHDEIRTPETRQPILQPYTSVIKRNLDITEEKPPPLHQVLNYKMSEIPKPVNEEFYNFQDESESFLQDIKTEELDSDISCELFRDSQEETNLQDNQGRPESESYKIFIPKRRGELEVEFESSDEEISKPREVSSIVPLKKRQRMMEIPYAIGHAINKKVNPVMSFTFEEEFKVMDYIVRIEQYQNRRFEFVESQFPRYRELCASIIQMTALGKKVPYNYNIDQTLFNIGLDFTKRACVDIYEEMGLLSVDVRREILNSTYPALYVVMFAIMEGNTRETTWVDQQMKTLHVTKENHSSMMPFTKALQGVRAVSLKDQEKFTSPWAVTDLDEEKFDKTISYLGRLLRDDIQLQALYHMLVMLSPCAANSKKIQHNKALVTVQREVAALLYRYLCTTTTMHYSKTPGQQDNARDRGEGSHIMTLSEGIEDLSPADKTELLLGLIPDLHDCVDIMTNRRILVQAGVDT